MIETDTRRLSLPGGRRVGGSGHDTAQVYLETRMSETGLEFFSGKGFGLTYESEGIEFTNLAGVIPGSDPEAMPVLLGAHYDSAIDGPSSDDNAVSIALLLSAVGQLREMCLKRSVILVFFDAEEAPYFGTTEMGSVRFHRDHCYDVDFASVIILDMIGHDFEVMIPVLDRTVRRIREFLFILGSESHGFLPAIVEQAASGIKRLKVIPTLNRYLGDTSDQLSFRRAGQPFLMIGRGRGRHSHTMNDSVQWIDFSAVERVLELVLEIVRFLDTASMEENRCQIDPFEFEIRMLKKAAGPFLPLILPLLGYWSGLPRSRNDLDRLASKLHSVIRL